MHWLIIKSQKHRRGFTMVDLVVASTVIIIIFTVVLANFRGVNKNNLSPALQNLAADLFEAQTMGLAGRLFSASEPEYPAGGYGLIFQTSPLVEQLSYEIFGDKDSDGELDLGEIISDGNKRVLAGNRIIGLYFTEEVNPPAIADPLNPAWQETSELAVLFNQGETAVYFFEAPTVSHVLLELQNDNSGRKGYVYISVKTGLINNGFIE